MVWEAVSAGLDYLGGERANRANKKLAREQMAFQERMSNTAHQRQVKDLRAAGLNPILSAKLGGASSPGGALATMQNVAAGPANTIAKYGNQLTLSQTAATKEQTKATKIDNRINEKLADWLDKNEWARPFMAGMGTGPATAGTLMNLFRSWMGDEPGNDQNSAQDPAPSADDLQEIRINPRYTERRDRARLAGAIQKATQRETMKKSPFTGKPYKRKKKRIDREKWIPVE